MSNIIAVTFEPAAAPAPKVIGYLDATPHAEPDGTCPFMVEHQRGVVMGAQWFTSPHKLSVYERIRIEANEQKRTHAERLAALVQADSERTVTPAPTPANLGRKSAEWEAICAGWDTDSRFKPEQRYRGGWDVQRRAGRDWYGHSALWVYGTVTLSSLAKHAKKYDVDMHGVVQRNVEVMAVLSIRTQAVILDRRRWLTSIAKQINHESEQKLLRMTPRKWYRHKQAA